MKSKRWVRVQDDYPKIGESVEILHFGGIPGMEIKGIADVDGWGICPISEGHAKRSTVTHWRRNLR